ncbi:MAG: hypothetical protein EOM20_07050 [Spartobacteria bacterium]|nr:hypothetical protein [Spartobacteria bacterium]
MKKTTTVWGFMMILVAGGAIASPVQLELGPVMDKDLVWEKRGMQGCAEAFGANPNAVHAFVEDGYIDTETQARGLPSSRFLRSPRPELGIYRMASYTGPNAIELASAEDAEPERHRIEVPKGRYALLGLLVSSVDGDSSFTIELQYADGHSDALWWEADDWYDLGPRGNLAKVIRDMDRVDISSGAIDAGNHFNLYEFVVMPDAGKELEAIVIGSDPHRWPIETPRWAAVFAINGVLAE